MKRYTYKFTHYYADMDPIVVFGSFDYLTKRGASRAGERVLRIIRRNTRSHNVVASVVEVDKEGNIK